VKAATLDLTSEPSILRPRLRAFAADTWVLTRRNVLVARRTPALVVVGMIMPVMFVLLFRYVLGQAIQVPGFPRYVDYLVPGVIVQTALFGGSSSAVGVAEDFSRGVTDRYRSLPASRLAILAARTLADLLRLTFTMVLIVSIGLLVGFRLHNGLLPSLAGLGVVLAFGYACSWLFTYLGLLVRNVEAATMTALAITFPLVFAASTFTSARTMPHWLGVFAANQPVTHVVDTLRILTQGTGRAGPTVLAALAWSLGILVASAALAVRRFRRI
jgi:ABC-2 type transport system permease protein